MKKAENPWNPSHSRNSLLAYFHPSEAT